MRIQHDNWLQVGRRLYGPDPTKWKFRCPCCSHVACYADFPQLLNQSRPLEAAAMTCLGTTIAAGRPAFSDGPGPCDYQAGGLFDQAPVTIVLENGQTIRVFDFADSFFDETADAEAE